MRLISISFLFALTLTASAALGQLSQKYADWANGPVKHLMTKEEVQQWKDIHTDEAAIAFIDLFWAKRDPTPDTPRNEFHEAFDARVKAADEQFTSKHVRGAMSDPGKVLILLGPPEQVGSSAGAGPSGGGIDSLTGRVAVAQSRTAPNRMVWTYAHDKKPKYINLPDFVLVFDDEGQNDWQLGISERTNPNAILLQAVHGLIVSPNLTKAPFPSTAPAAPPAVTTTAVKASFHDAAIDAAYKQFRTGDKPSVGTATLTWGEFVSPEGDPFVSVQLYIPAGSEIRAGEKATFFGAIENANGEIVKVEEAPATLAPSGPDSYADRSLQLAPGTYNATFGLAADGHILTANRTTLKVETIDATSSGISPLILSNNVTPLQTSWEATDPYTFGGLKVVPKGDGTFTPKGDLWYFLELRKPGLTPEGAPKIRVKIDIRGKTAKGPAVMSFPASDANAAKLKGTTDRYAIGQAIPLEGFIPGDYTMKIHVEDTIQAKSYDLEREFHVHGL